jgi:hypothetical protein
VLGGGPSSVITEAVRHLMKTGKLGMDLYTRMHAHTHTQIYVYAYIHVYRAAPVVRAANAEFARDGAQARGRHAPARPCHVSSSQGGQ